MSTEPSRTIRPRDDSTVGGKEPEDRGGERALPRARLTDETHDLSATELEPDTGQDSNRRTSAAVLDSEVVDLEDDVA